MESSLKTVSPKTKFPKSYRRQGLLFSFVHKTRGGLHSPLSNPPHRLTPSPFVIHSPSYLFLNFFHSLDPKNPLVITIDLPSHESPKFIISWPYFLCMYRRLERPEWILKKNKSPQRVQDLQQPFQCSVPISPANSYGAGTETLKSAGISPGEGELPL